MYGIFYLMSENMISEDNVKYHALAESKEDMEKQVSYLKNYVAKVYVIEIK